MHMLYVQLIKKYTYLILTLLLIGILLDPIPAKADSVPTSSDYSLSVNTNKPETGGSFTVTASAVVSELFAFEAIFSYDSQKLELLHYETTENGYLIKPAQGDGEVVLAWSKDGRVLPSNGPMNIARLTFKALKEGDTEVNWQSLKIANRSLQEVAILPDISQRVQVQSETTDPGKEPVITPGPGRGGDVNGPVVPDVDMNAAPQVAVLADPAQTMTLSGQAVSYTPQPGNGLHVVVNSEQAIQEIAASAKGISTYVVKIPELNSTAALAVEVEIASEVLQAIRSKNGSSGFLIIASPLGMYKLPIEQLSTVEHAKVMVTLTTVSVQQAQSMDKLVSDEGFTRSGMPVDFSVSLIQAPGQASEWQGYDRTFTVRTLSAGNIDPGRSAVVLFRPDGTMVPAPALFVKQKDGSYIAVIHGMGNGTYGLITGSRTFADLSGHWSQHDIEAMAGRLLVNGDTEGRFRPDDPITRAEFAKLVTGALALPEKKDGATFSDVDPVSWYARSLSIAVSFGLIEGYEGGIFRPMSIVSREEIAVMLERALRLTGYQADSPALLVHLSDMDQLNEWSKASIQTMVGLGVIMGNQENKIQPAEPATRAEAAIMLKRLLIKLSFMNP
ncbi:Endo-1,4-beta-xylanase A precursor [compost metagenome]